MKILLIQPAQERGLGFRSLAVVEPLGLESIAGSLSEHKVKILDLRLENHLPRILQDFQPDFCGINCSFTIDVYQTREISTAIKAWNLRVSLFSWEGIMPPYPRRTSTVLPSMESLWGKGKSPFVT